MRSERGDFNSRPHGMYFDVVVVEVKTFLLLFGLALAILWLQKRSVMYTNFMNVIS